MESRRGRVYFTDQYNLTDTQSLGGVIALTVSIVAVLIEVEIENESWAHYIY